LAMAQMSGGNFILHSCGILDSYNTVSLEKMMIDYDIMGMMNRIGRGEIVNEETLAFDLIKEVGPQGEFITSDYTLENHFEEMYQPKLSDRDFFNIWEKNGSLTAEQRANKLWKKMLEEYVQPELDKDIDAELQKMKEEVH
ncbi:MAG: trimethylamine--corrinoid methyltransferase, partial [Actinobacteria bacterium]|nr:trimethylamine--corrinoid methyltransferase [Actinomycetota bacterium]